ncbi:hypothetical protein TNCV_4379891 [Trichonephila clavipes]|nr:hypothetical protein TNCV_4379891 [Trichonephila clavipes]
MAPHSSKKAAPTEITTDDEDMITYDVEEEELEQIPRNKFTIDEEPLNVPKRQQVAKEAAVLNGGNRGPAKIGPISKTISSVYVHGGRRRARLRCSAFGRPFQCHLTIVPVIDIASTIWISPFEIHLGFGLLLLEIYSSLNPPKGFPISNHHLKDSGN